MSRICEVELKRVRRYSISPIRDAALDAWWQALPTDLKAAIAQQPIYETTWRTPEHWLWATAQAFQQQADVNLQAAETLALQALATTTNALDQHCAYTILINIYARQPEKTDQCIRWCEAAIAQIEGFKAAWVALARQQNPNRRDKDIAIPRLDAFERLLAIYEARGDDAAANAVCHKAIAAGFTEYQARIKSMIAMPSTSVPIASTPPRGWGWLYWLLLLIGTSITAFSYSLYQAEQGASRLEPLLLLVALGSLTLFSLLAPDTLRANLLAIPRTLRRQPLLVWFLLLLAGMNFLIQWELARHAPEQRDFYAWLMVWGISWLFFAGITAAEWRLMRASIGRNRATGVLVMLTTFALIIIAMELGLRHVFYFSNTYAIGLIHKRWDQAYWQPLNELTFRDYPIRYDVPAGTQRLLVLGDSFAAGFGVTDIEQTFPHLLGKSLGERYAISLVAHAGWNTNNQVIGLRDYPIKPDLLVYSYFLNDITYIDPSLNSAFGQLFPPPPPEIGLLVDNFYVGNFLYWNIYNQRLRGGDAGYGRQVTDVYRDAQLWLRHTEDMQQIIDYARRYDAPAVALVWPVLTQVEASAPMAKQVEMYFNQQGIPTVSMADELAGRPAWSIIVNPFDMHPNAATHRLAAEKLYETLVDAGIVSE